MSCSAIRPLELRTFHILTMITHDRLDSEVMDIFGLTESARHGLYVEPLQIYFSIMLQKSIQETLRIGI